MRPYLPPQSAVLIIAHALAGAVSAAPAAEAPATTEQHFLSGHGPKDAVPWEFAVTNGRRAGEWTTIPVPSNWEQHGFGTYEYGEVLTPRADEHGLYRHHFTVPADWLGRRIRIVFDGVMTDTTVKINGQPDGPLHQGGFYQFRHDITALLHPGKDNLLEVEVAKTSANPLTERAERHADYWVFGGIFRPVFLAHDTEVGRKLVREMITRDVNHPSILFWDNGNEGGWNRELDGEFARFDPQGRRVLHPWETFNGVDTSHYPGFAEYSKRLAGSNIVMPTEMIHGLYDGGAGAGLEDYWKANAASPVGGGGFLWVLADEGIQRTDQGGRIDVCSTFAPDGIVGPHHEKEASFHTVRDIFSPVQIDAPLLDGRFSG